MAISGDANAIELIDRRRIEITDSKVPGARQPYHYAASAELLGLAEKEKYLADCAAVSERLALAAVGELARELEAHQYRVIGSAVLLASGRPLQAVSQILASHPLIHTAEGEFFRNAVRQACEHLKIPVTAIKERDLDARINTAFGNAANEVQRGISTLGRSMGPPWTKDQKNAALAAAIILADNRQPGGEGGPT
ncbi:MAG TPA: hypothetical protein VFA76_01315 [Terriglobales bacterium]|nr:hypothetical protein [Terriglobales bacterium]